MYFFRTRAEAEDGFVNWYQDRYSEDEPFTLLEVDLEGVPLSHDPELPLSAIVSYVPVEPWRIVSMEDI